MPPRKRSKASGTSVAELFAAGFVCTVIGNVAAAFDGTRLFLARAR